MQQTREELLRLAFECLRRAARLLDAAGDDLLVINGEERRAYGETRRFCPNSPIKGEPPCRYQFDLAGSIRPGDASCAGRRYLVAPGAVFSWH